ncbi:MAG: hypothetical protein QXT25_00735 [Candidatus Anstonellaceae archaeon]
MTSLAGMALSYLLLASFSSETALNFSSLDKLVDFEFDFAYEGLIPNQPYSGSVKIYWAIPNQSLHKLQSDKLIVKVRLISFSDSIKFIVNSSPTQQAEIFLFCKIENGSCSNESVLYSEVPTLVVVSNSTPANISIQSEIVPAERFENAKLELPLGNMASIKLNFTPSADFLPSLPNHSDSDFLDALKPQGNHKDPIEYLKENPIVSLTALVIVILITGAYLLNSKD